MGNKGSGKEKMSSSSLTLKPPLPLTLTGSKEQEGFQTSCRRCSIFGSCLELTGFKLAGANSTKLAL